MKLLYLVLALFSAALFAGDSGLYFDQTRNGEGISLHRNGDQIVFYLFTYGEDGCNATLLPSVGPRFFFDNCYEQGQRWFFGNSKIEDETELDGFLYMTYGLNYPDGVVQPDNPWVIDVADVMAVGFFTLRRWQTGWQLLVVPFGPYLSTDDVLYSRVYNFDTKLFPGID